MQRLLCGPPRSRRFDGEPHLAGGTYARRISGVERFYISGAQHRTCAGQRILNTTSRHELACTGVDRLFHLLAEAASIPALYIRSPWNFDAAF